MALVIGIDIGSEFNAVCLMDKEGNVIGKYPKIYNSRKGFDYFHTIVEQARRKSGFTDILIGMEPTGHYWRKIGFYAVEQGYQVRFVRTTALKHRRELDESSSTKTDMRDAFTIANIVREGKYIDTVIEEGVFRQLRTLSHTRERIVRYNTGSKHALKAVLDDYFPELKALFLVNEVKGPYGSSGDASFPGRCSQGRPSCDRRASHKKYQKEDSGAREGREDVSGCRGERRLEDNRASRPCAAFYTSMK